MLSDFVVKDPFIHAPSPIPKSSEIPIYRPFAGLETPSDQAQKKSQASQLDETIPKQATNSSESSFLTYFPCPHEHRATYEMKEFCKDCGARKYNAGFALKSEDMKQLVVTSPNRIYRKVFQEKKTIANITGHTDYLQNRQSTINFMTVLGEKMGICKPSVYLGVYFMDILVSEDDGNTEFSPLKVEENLGMYGGIAVFLGSKGIDLDDRVPLITALHYYLKLPMYSKEDLIKAEKKALSILKFEMHRPTLYDLLYFYAGQGIIFPDDKQKVLQKTESPTRTKNNPLGVEEQGSTTPLSTATPTQQNTGGKQVVTAVMVKYDINPFKFLDIVTKIEKDLVKLAFLAIKENDFYSYDLEVLGAACVCFLREKLSLWDGYRDDFLEISGQQKTIVQQCRSKFLTRFEQYFRPNISFIQSTQQPEPSATSSQSLTANQASNSNISATSQTPQVEEPQSSQVKSVPFSTLDMKLPLSGLPDFSNWRVKESIITNKQNQTTRNSTSFSQYSKINSGNLSTRNTVSEVAKVESKGPESTNCVSFATLSDFATSSIAKNYPQLDATNFKNESQEPNVDTLIAKSKIDISSQPNINNIPSYSSKLSNFNITNNNNNNNNTNNSSSSQNSTNPQPISGLSSLAEKYLRELSSSPLPQNASPQPQQQSSTNTMNIPQLFSSKLNQINNTLNTPSSSNSPMLPPSKQFQVQKEFKSIYNKPNNSTFNSNYTPLNGTPISSNSTPINSNTPLETFSQLLNKNYLGTQETNKLSSVFTPINQGISNNPVNGGNFCKTVTSMGYGSTSSNPSSFLRKNQQ